MSVQRIDSPHTNTHGWQARWPLPGTRKVKRRLTRFFADDKHGGTYHAWEMAQRAEKRRQRAAKQEARRG